MDRTTMEKPEGITRSLTMLVPPSLHTELRRMAFLRGESDSYSMGALCRDLLSIINFKLYKRLYEAAQAKKLPIRTLVRQILEEGLKSRE